MFTTRPEIVGTFGVVASTHWLATAAGMAMLEKGGNAFDAAVATGRGAITFRGRLIDFPIAEQARRIADMAPADEFGHAPANHAGTIRR